MRDFSTKEVARASLKGMGSEREREGTLILCNNNVIQDDFMHDKDKNI